MAGGQRCQESAPLLNFTLPQHGASKSIPARFFRRQNAISGRILETNGSLRTFYEVQVNLIRKLCPTGHLLEGISTP